MAGAVLVAVGLVGGLAVASPAAAADPEPPFGRTADACFVDTVLPIFARRPATAEETADALARLTGGTTRGRLVRDLGRSDAWVQGVVTDLYESILDRGPEPGGLAYWSDRLRAGAPVADLGVAIWTSAESVGRHPTVEAYVAAVISVLLGRTATPAEVDFWASATVRRGRAWTTRQLYRTAEHRGERVDALYQAILGRAAEAGGRAYWVDRLLRVNEVELAIQLAASAELFARAVRTCPPIGTTTTLVTDISAPSISDDGSVVTFWSRRADLVDGDTNGQVDLFVLDRTTDVVTRVYAAPPPGEVSHPQEDATVSGDGSTVVFTTPAPLLPADEDDVDDVYRWERASGALALLSGAERGYAVDVSADGDRVSWVGPGTVFLWDAATGETTVFPPTAGTSVREAALSADGSTLVWALTWSDVCCGGTVYPVRSQLRSVDVETGVVEVIDDRTGLVGHIPAVDGDGGTVAFSLIVVDGVDTTVLRVWDRATGTFTDVPRSASPQLELDPPSLADEGGRVVFTRGTDLWLYEPATGTVRLLTTAGTAQTKAAMSGDGRHVAFLSGSVVGSAVVTELVVWDEVPVAGP